MAKPEFSCSVVVRHLPEQSEPPAGPWAFAYTISIVNSGDVTAQLIARHWIVRDANNQARALAQTTMPPMPELG